MRFLIDKVVVHMGVGEAGDRLVSAEKILTEITGNKPSAVLPSRPYLHSVFERVMPLSCKTTLRGAAAEEFLETSLKVVGNKLIRHGQSTSRGIFPLVLKNTPIIRVRVMIQRSVSLDLM